MRRLNNRAVSVIEYVVLIIVVISAFLVMRHLLQRGIYGNWAKTGQSYGFGRQYDPQQTVECSFDEESNQWYDRNCYAYYINNKQCNGIDTCQEGVITSGLCAASSCGQLNH